MGMTERPAEEILVMGEKGGLRQSVKKGYQVFIEGAVP
jgi:hypothetical protein